MIVAKTRMKELPEYCYECDLEYNGECMPSGERVSDWRPYWCPLEEKVDIAELAQRERKQIIENIVYTESEE